MLTEATQKAMMSSEKSDWETPDDFYGVLDAMFHFTVDVCATSENCKNVSFIDAETDALSVDWHTTNPSGRAVCWMNPPYGHEIVPWVRKAREEGEKGAVVVCLLPARTDTKWWHENVMVSSLILLVRGRLKFKGATSSAPFPSAVVVFGPMDTGGREKPVVKSFNWTKLKRKLKK